MVERLPAYGAVLSASFKLEGNVSRFTSPLTQTQQVIVRAGARWSASYTLEVKSADLTSAGQWQGLLNRAEAQGTLIYVNDPYRTRPLPWADASWGTTCDSSEITIDSATVTCDAAHAWGDPRVAGGSQTGSSLETKGWPPAITVLNAGDYFAFDNSVFRELHQAAEDAVSDASGNATIEIAGVINRSPLDDVAILIDGKDIGSPALAAAEMRIKPGTVRFTGQLPRLISISFEAQEALR